MTPDFFDLSYLAAGTPAQRKGYEMIKASKVMEILKEFNPVLAGTLPLDLFVEGSDLDILCFSKDLDTLEKIWIKNFVHHKEFSIHSKLLGKIRSLVARFIFEGYLFELVAQPVPTDQQVAYLHMVKEFQILEKEGEDFKQKIIALKIQGVKTEPAFAKLLDLDGDANEVILKYKK